MTNLAKVTSSMDSVTLIAGDLNSLYGSFSSVLDPSVKSKCDEASNLLLSLIPEINNLKDTADRLDKTPAPPEMIDEEPNPLYGKWLADRGTFNNKLDSLSTSLTSKKTITQGLSTEILEMLKAATDKSIQQTAKDLGTNASPKLKTVQTFIETGFLDNVGGPLATKVKDDAEATKSICLENLNELKNLKDIDKK
jgi:hypothetical protein